MSEFMTTWRSLRRLQEDSDAARGAQVGQLMHALLEQYAPELQQSELTECLADLGARKLH